MSHSDLLRELARIAKALAAILPDCEKVVHDLQWSPESFSRDLELSEIF
jgi:hypothetical protein